MISLHDCFGSILRSLEGGGFSFVCAECGKPFASLNKEGISVISKHGNGKHKNQIALKALKRMIREVEKYKSDNA